MADDAWEIGMPTNGEGEKRQEERGHNP